MRSGQAERTAPPQLPGLKTVSGNWDATKSNPPAELLQRGLELAQFVVGDRSCAIEVLVRALEKLRVHSRREKKKFYWRDKHADRPVRRIMRGDVDVLQWLVLSESEQDERMQERAGIVSPVSMAIHYIKYLVQITTALSSFYVNVGITRLLHNYGTPEAQRAYETLTSRFLGRDEYRRAKSSLMDKASERFAGFVKIVRVDHGEVRFEMSDHQEQWAELTADCLKAFTPWSTQGICAQFVSSDGDKAKLESVYWNADADQNKGELTCCHILIDPTCYGQLMEGLGFDQPETKLALPRFAMPEEQEKNRDINIHTPHPPKLSQEEIDHIERRLANSDMRRRAINPRTVTIFIDGVEQARLDLSRRLQFEIGLEAGVSLIEVRGEDDRGELPLATHFIAYANNAFNYSGGTARLSNGTLEFQVTPVAMQGHGPSHAFLRLDFRPRFSWARPWAGWHGFKSALPRIRVYALSGLVIALIGSAITGAFYSQQIKSLEQKLQETQRLQQLSSPTSAGAIISYRLTRDDQRVRGSQTPPIPEVSLRLHSTAISLEIPLSAPEARTYTTELMTFTGDQTLMTQNFLRPARSDGGTVVEVVVPANLLNADNYYTVHLHSSGRTELFTFKVVDNR